MALVSKAQGLILKGRAAEALPCVAELDQFGLENPVFVKLNKGLLLVDIANDLQSAEYATQGVSLMKEIDPQKIRPSLRSSYWYNLGNGYSAVYNLKRIPPGAQRAMDVDFLRAKQCYRKAMLLPAMSPESAARLCTNYGTLLRTVGRHVEEIEAYDDALKAVPGHAIALWHKSKGLCWYSRLVEPPTKRSTLLEARDLLKKSLGAGLEPGRRTKAEKELAELDRILKSPTTPSRKHTRHEANSKIEKKYIHFCVDNRLYLHPCPISSHQAYQDPLSVRFATETKGEYLELRSDELALIKQEYIAARFLLFSNRHKLPDLSFVGREAFLPSRGEAENDVFLQFLNLSFRAAYAVLDKIAYFLNGFCKLGQNEKGIYFRKEFFLRNVALRPGLARYDGPQLAALLDLASEFSGTGPLYDLRNLRRKLEHRCLVIRRGQKAQEANRLNLELAPGETNELGEDELYEASLRLFRAVRAAILYLFYFVRGADKPRVSP